MPDVDITYSPHKFQNLVHSDYHRYRVVVAGRRFGKSVLARQEIVRKALSYKPQEHKGIHITPRFWIISPTYRQGKEIHWIELKKEIPPSLIKKVHEVELAITLFNDVVLELKGADNPDSLRGAGLMGAVLDEAAYQKKNVWDEIIQPMLLSTEGWSLFIGTPKGYNWFFKLYQKGVKGTKQFDEEWASWRFTSYNNPFVKKEEIDKKQEQISADTFAQEYLAEFTTFEGRIYKEFKPQTHVIKPIKIPDDWRRYGGFDFSGGKEPAALIMVVVDPDDDTWYVIKEVYMKEKPSRLMISEMRAELEGGLIGKVETIWCDPHMKQLWEDYKDNQFYMSPARKETQTQVRGWVRHGIDIIKNKLNVNPVDGKTQLYVFDTCKKLIEEFQMYEWKEAPNEEISEPGVPIKKNDHGLDAFRYFAVSYRKQKDYSFETIKKSWRIGKR